MTQEFFITVHKIQKLVQIVKQNLNF